MQVLLRVSLYKAFVTNLLTADRLKITPGPPAMYVPQVKLYLKIIYRFKGYKISICQLINILQSLKNQRTHPPSLPFGVRGVRVKDDKDFEPLGLLTTGPR